MGIYSHKLCTYVRGVSCSGMSQGMLLHVQICSTQIWRRQHSFVMEMEVGDDRAAGHRGLDTYKHQTASPRPTANMTRATYALPAPAYDACT